MGPVLMFHAVGMLVGGFVAAWFMGRTSYRVVIAGCMAGASIAMAAAGFIPPGASMAVFTFAESMFLAAFSRCCLWFTRNISGANRLERYEVSLIRWWWRRTLWARCSRGYVYESTGAYTMALAAFSAVLAVGAASALLARRPA